MNDSRDPTTVDARIHPAISVAVEEFTETLAAACGTALLGLTFFGHAVTGAFDERRNVARGVIVLREIDLDLLHRLSLDGSRWGRRRVAAPLVMTPPYIRASLDSFPLEFLEIHVRRVTVFGEDYFAELDWDAPAIRVQCERELKTILMAMRQGLLAAAGRESMVAPIVVEAMDSLIRVLRGMLWFHRVTEYLPPTDLVERVEQVVGASLPAVRRDLSEFGEPNWTQFGELYGDVERLAQSVDRW